MICSHFPFDLVGVFGGPSTAWIGLVFSQVDVMRTRGNHPAFGVEMRESLGVFPPAGFGGKFCPPKKMVDFWIREFFFPPPNPGNIQV